MVGAAGRMEGCSISESVGLSWMFRGPELDGTGFVWRWEDRETVQQVSPVLGPTGPPPPSSSSSSCRVSCASFSSSSWIYPAKKKSQWGHQRISAGIQTSCVFGQSLKFWENKKKKRRKNWAGLTVVFSCSSPLLFFFLLSFSPAVCRSEKPN